MNVDELAQEIRRVDGNHSLGAGALAEAIMPFIRASLISEREEMVNALRAIIKWDDDTLSDYLPVALSKPARALLSRIEGERT